MKFNCFLQCVPSSTAEKIETYSGLKNKVAKADEANDGGPGRFAWIDDLLKCEKKAILSMNASTVGSIIDVRLLKSRKVLRCLRQPLTSGNDAAILGGEKYFFKHTSWGKKQLFHFLYLQEFGKRSVFTFFTQSVSNFFA